MRIRLKRLREQTVVVTDAAGGVGVAIARKAAARGARLVLAARDAEALEALIEEIRAAGADAQAVVADVAVESDVKRIADTAVNRFGGFDTWINNAALAMDGPLLDIGIDDQRRVFDTNYWSVVYGSLAAVRHLRSRGGALINVGSVLSDVAVPVRGTYSASKHAVKGFTDALRMELESEGAPVSVTLIKPSALEPQYVHRAEAHLQVEPRTPPGYSTQLAADAVLHAAEHPIRDMVVGGGGKLLSLAGTLAPGLTNRLLQGTATRLQRAGGNTSGSPYSNGRIGVVHGNYPAPALRRHLYDEAAKRRLATTAVALGAGLLLWAVMRRR